MYRLAEELARKLMKNNRSPEIGPIDINQKDPFAPKNTHSIGFMDPYAAIGLDFDFVLEFPYPFINPNLPPVNTLNGYWLYKKGELKRPEEPFDIPKYLADPNLQNAEELMDVSDCSVMLPSDVDKLSATSILTLEALIRVEPTILDCLNKDIK